ncbi:MMPL family transporter [Actinoplanes utahensis]|uniref:MMPL family transporter n=1 Tax=Actinoplanes utahensis TaxID=1869 RepID=UPI00068F6D66|nr:MMPL family transporter [Actinoplanes utahensis]GIF27279.1 hypothetical protein Aut01nite_02650 [Actinoplanes utahensis]
MTRTAESLTGKTRGSVFERLAGWSGRHRWTALLLWVVVLAAATTGSGLAGTDFRNDFTLPGAESQAAQDLLSERAPTRAGETLQIVVRDPGGLAQPATRATVEAMLAEVRGLPHVVEVVSPYPSGGAPPTAISADGTIGYASVALDATGEQIPSPDIRTIIETARSAALSTGSAGTGHSATSAGAASPTGSVGPGGSTGQTGSGAPGDKAVGGGLTVEVGGDAVRTAEESGGGPAEGAGLLAALIVLVLLFGSLLAASLPIVIAVFAVGTAIGLVALASHVATVADFTTPLVVLVGLGVGIDYALLVLSRFRGELAAGADRESAIRTALDTAGRTVFFAGTTVIIALLGLILIGLGALQGVAVALAVTVLVTMLAALVLLPALLSLVGPRLERTMTRRRDRASRSAPESTRGGEGSWWRRWSDAVARRPWPAALLPLIFLGALCAPVLDMRLGFADAGTDAETKTSTRAYDLLATGFGPGVNGPLVIVVDASGTPATPGGATSSGPTPGGTSPGGVSPGGVSPGGPASSGGGASPTGGPASTGGLATPGGGSAEAAAGAVRQVLLSTPGIASATPPIPAPGGDVATVIAFPASAPQDEATSELVATLRNDVLVPVARDNGVTVLVGGPTAAVVDVSEAFASRLPLFVAVVVGLSALLLLVLFRSIVIPVKAALLNLLSVGAALGVMILVFQNGAFGVAAGPIEAFVPVMIFAIVFGLSMDYEVFLLARMHEEWERTRDAAHAVREGLATTGRVVTAAAAIMIVVFGSFLLFPDRMLQQFGLGLAVAVLIDAVIIRCLLLPAVMHLFGARAWWLPPALARRLPRLALEHR